MPRAFLFVATCVCALGACGGDVRDDGASTGDSGSADQTTVDSPRLDALSCPPLTCKASPPCCCHPGGGWDESSYFCDESGHWACPPGDTFHDCECHVSCPLRRDSGTPPDADDASETSDGDTTTDVEAGAAALTITGLTVHGDCMPIVPPDPILASWTASISGATGSVATLVDAKLVITSASTVTQHLTVDHPDVSLAGGAGSQAQSKTGADVTPAAAFCGEFCSGATASLDLTFDTAGGPLNARAEVPFDCAF